MYKPIIMNFLKQVRISQMQSLEVKLMTILWQLLSSRIPIATLVEIKPIVALKLDYKMDNWMTTCTFNTTMSETTITGCLIATGQM